MADGICLIVNCERPAASRGLCTRCYGHRYRAGTLAEFPRKIGWAKVTNVDEDAMTCDCPRCGPKVLLRVRRDARGGYECRKCSRGIKISTPASRRMEKYGITSEEFSIRLTAQGDKCLICRVPLDEAGMAVDHDHARGHVRGILCRSCNLGLGFFKDRPEVMRRAAKYVVNYRNSSG